MTGDEPSADALVDLLDRAVEQAAGLASSVSPAELDLPTPCSEWTVRELLRHMVGGVRSFRAVAEGGQMTGFDVAVDDANLARQYRDGAAALVAAWRAEGATATPRTMFGGEVPATMPLNLQVTEAAVHCWDLATALGRGTSLDPGVAEAALSFAEANLGPDRRGPSFAAARDAPAGADPSTRLAAFSGREVPG